MKTYLDRRQNLRECAEAGAGDRGALRGASAALAGLDFDSAEQSLAPDPIQAKADADPVAPVQFQRGGGSPLPADLATSMGAAFGADFGDVQLHRGSSAATQMGARAFASGSDIHLAPGQDITGQAGRELLGHELTHVVQQRAGRVSTQAKGGLNRDSSLEAEADVLGAKAARGEKVQVSGKAAAAPSGSGMVQAKLSGLTGVLTSQGGRSKKKHSNWRGILKSLSAYEAREAQLIAKCGAAKPRERAIRKMAKSMAKDLQSLQKKLQRWLKNEDNMAAVDKRANERREASVSRTFDAWEFEQEDGVKVKRFNQVKLLQVRVARELQELRTGAYREKLGVSYSDDNVTNVVDNKLGGEMSKLDLVTHDGKAGIFQRDNYQDDNYGMTAAKDQGIPEVAPNYGGRAIAMKRLATLLGIGDKIVDTDFATHQREVKNIGGEVIGQENVMGVRMGVAKGQSAHDLIGSGQMDIENPLVQQGLNQLQMLDAICSQFDRHAMNFFIDPKTGHVTGIDNDLAFGKNQKSVRGEKGATMGSHDRELPKLVDSKMAHTIMAVEPDAVREALAGLLSDGEVEATLSRLQVVKDHLVKLKNAKPASFKEADEWDQHTALHQAESAGASYVATIGKHTGMVRGHDVHDITDRFKELGLQRGGDSDGIEEAVYGHSVFKHLMATKRVTMRQLPGIGAYVRNDVGAQITSLKDEVTKGRKAMDPAKWRRVQRTINAGRDAKIKSLVGDSLRRYIAENNVLAGRSGATFKNRALNLVDRWCEPDDANMLSNYDAVIDVINDAIKNDASPFSADDGHGVFGAVREALDMKYGAFMSHDARNFDDEADWDRRQFMLETAVVFIKQRGGVI